MKLIGAIVLCILIISTIATQPDKFSRINQSTSNDQLPRKLPMNIIPRIANGNVALFKSYTYHALVITKDHNGKSKNCNGAILNENWIVSTAHCLEKAKNVIVEIGSVKYNKPVLSVTPDAVINHPQYRPDNAQNNIALLRIPASQTLKFPTGKFPSFSPVRLPRKQQLNETFVDSVAYFSSFGSSDYYVDKSDNLRFAATKIIPNKECVRYYPKNHDLVHSDVLCAVTNDAKQVPCKNDGGAPLVINEYGRNTLIGLLSFSHENEGCGGQSLPIGFTRITSHFGWITSITNYQIRP